MREASSGEGIWDEGMKRERTAWESSEKERLSQSDSHLEGRVGISVGM
jgi:hypothetical protein